MAETIQQKLRERMDDAAVAVKYGDEQRTWREHLADASAQAAALLGIADTTRPLHIGALLGNTPDMLTAMAAAGLGGYVLCGINNTRRGAALARDIVHADCQILLTDEDHRDLLAGLDLPGVRVLDVGADEWAALLAGAGPLTPHHEAGAMDTFMLIFTSGTSGDPKAVQVPHITVLMAGTALADRFRVTPADVCYLSMPLFHSNALLAGWSVAVESGATMVPAAFSASGLIDDVRRYGVTYMNYVGKPLAYVLATPQRPDDADNPLRIAFGNEASDRDIEEFGQRFGCTVWDGFGSTEGAVIVTREAGCPSGSIGRGFPGVAIYRRRHAGRVPPGGVRFPRCTHQRRQSHRRTGQHRRRRHVPGLLQGCVGHRRQAAQRHLLVGRSRVRGCRRLDLSGRAHVGLDEGRRREHGHGADRAGVCSGRTPSVRSPCTAFPTSTSATR